MNNTNLDLNNREWAEFSIKDLFKVINSRAHHKDKLQKTETDGIAYISRTNSDNGLEDVVSMKGIEKNNINPSHTVSFGAENATFFFQPFKYITGNKMYYISKELINKWSGIFISILLNSSIKNCGFGYGKGLTGTRVKKRSATMPLTFEGEPDYEFMEEYIKQKEKEKLDKYIKYLKGRVKELEDYEEVEGLDEKEWGEFIIEDLFTIKIGKNVDGNKIDKLGGKIAYVTRKENDNGLDGFISYKDDKYLNTDFPVITIGNETAKPFVQNYPFFTGTKVNILKHKSKLCLESYKFIAQCLEMHKVKYSYSFTANSTRLKRQRIMLPINSEGTPDYKYMKNHIRKLELKKIKAYLRFKNVNLDLVE